MEENRSPFDAEAIRALVRLVEENALAELTIEEGDYAVSLKADAAVQRMPLPATTVEPGPPVEAPVEDDRPRATIRAPMTGMFYRSPSPGEPPFIEPGDHVEPGQIIGLIEAMKVFSEVPAEVAGWVVEIASRNGELVHQDQVLVVLALEE